MTSSQMLPQMPRAKAASVTRPVHILQTTLPNVTIGSVEP